MTADERALLAAVVADPADDTVRLAYADCIEERGDAARAEFIRAQVAAERLHPDSNARAALEERAGALFAEHWVGWWGEVCAAVGLPMPAPKPTGRLRRLARRLGRPEAWPGAPYLLEQGWPDAGAVGVTGPLLRDRAGAGDSPKRLSAAASPITSNSRGGRPADATRS